MDNKRRTKFSTYLESYGIRVQKSAFEIRIDKKKFERMLKGIPAYVGQEDSVKLYRIQGNQEVLCWGTAKKEISEQVIIIG